MPRGDAAQPSGAELRALIVQHSGDDGILFAEGLDDALIGLAEGWFRAGRRHVAVYDATRILELLVDDGMEEAEAAEHYEFNISGAYVGDGTPAFVTLYRSPVLVSGDS